MLAFHVRPVLGRGPNVAPSHWLINILKYLSSPSVTAPFGNPGKLFPFVSCCAARMHQERIRSQSTVAFAMSTASIIVAMAKPLIFGGIIGFSSSRMALKSTSGTASRRGAFMAVHFSALARSGAHSLPLRVRLSL